MDTSSPGVRLSYAHGTSTAPLLGQTIGQNHRASYRQLWDATTRCARALLALGVEPGDRVGIWSTNRHEWVVVQYATARVGAILVTINPAYQAPELEYALKQS